jgi:hypothetical protein
MRPVTARHGKPSSLLKQLCAGPDGADKRNNYDLRRAWCLAQDQIARRGGTSEATSRAFTIAFSGLPKGRRRGLWVSVTVSKNRCCRRRGLASAAITP